MRVQGSHGKAPLRLAGRSRPLFGALCFLAAVLLLAQCGGKKGPSVYADFSGEKALAEVESVLAFGPRPPGSEGLEKVRVHLEERLQALGWETRRMTFVAPTPLKGPIEFANLRARFGAGSPVDWEAPVDVLYGSHIDSKYYSYKVFIGANDGGSSTGALVEMARVLAANPALAGTVELCFFDGEECFVQYDLRDGLYGSRHYARYLKNEVDPARWPRSMILLDMVGDADLGVRFPPNGSVALRDTILLSTEALQTRKFFGLGEAGRAVIDDHVPFLKIGIPAVDVIDLDFDPWHTPADTIDKLSAESLEIVGQAVLHHLENHLSAALKLEAEKKAGKAGP